MNQMWQTVPAAAAPCVCCTPEAFPEDKEYDQQSITMVRRSPEYRRLLGKWGKAEELAVEWRSIALAMREVNVQLVAANRALISEAHGLRVAA